MTKKFSLSIVRKDMSIENKKFLEGLQKEIVEEEKNSLKDFIKGAYRLSLEKEREVENLNKEIKQIQKAIELASGGEWDSLGKIKIPARFFNEETLRKHGKSLIEGSEEIRFMDLYSPEED